MHWEGSKGERRKCYLSKKMKRGESVWKSVCVCEGWGGVGVGGGGGG